MAIIEKVPVPSISTTRAVFYRFIEMYFVGFLLCFTLSMVTVRDSGASFGFGLKLNRMYKEKRRLK